MLKDGISVTVSFMKIRFSTRFWRRAGPVLEVARALAAWVWGQGLGTPSFHSLGSAGSEHRLGWGRLGAATASRRSRGDDS